MWEKIYSSGVLYLANVVDNLIMQKVAKNSSAGISYGYVPMRYDTYTRQAILHTGGFFTVLLLLVALIIPFLTLIGRLIDDKQSRMRETLQIMGMSNTAYFCSHFIWYALHQVILTYGLSFIYCNKIYPTTSYFLLNSSFYIYLLTLFPIGILISYSSFN